MRICPICREQIGYTYQNVKIQVGFAQVCQKCKKDKSVPFGTLIKWNVAKERIHNPYRIPEEDFELYLWEQEDGIYVPYEPIEE